METLSESISLSSMMRVSRIPVFSVLLIWACLLQLSCTSGDSPRLTEVTGSVIYRGSPVSNGSVMFIPQDGGIPGVGITDKEGCFTLMTNGRKGATSGQHVVVITAVIQTKELTEEEFDLLTKAQLEAIRKSVIPEKYGNRDTSGLVETIDSQERKQQFHFVLVD